MKTAGRCLLFLAALLSLLPLGTGAAELEPAASAAITARKTLDGEIPPDGMFSFRLISEEGALVQEVENAGETAAFGSLRFPREGTYRYFLKEAAGMDQGVIYDRTVYTVTVEVAEDSIPKVSYLRNGKPYAGLPAFASCRVSDNPRTGDGIITAFTVLVFSTAALGILAAFRKA